MGRFGKSITQRQGKGVHLKLDYTLKLHRWLALPENLTKYLQFIEMTDKVVTIILEFDGQLIPLSHAHQNWVEPGFLNLGWPRLSEFRSHAPVSRALCYTCYLGN